MSAAVEDGGGPTAEETAAKAVHKRFEGLLTVRNKAVKGKGAWYWAHLEPLLLHNSDNGLPKAVKLKCCFCNAVFSASNPSRTASEHLKRGTCPNFSSLVSPGSDFKVESKTEESAALPKPQYNHRKRRRRESLSSGSGTAGDGGGVVMGMHNTSAINANIVGVDVAPNNVADFSGGALVVHPQGLTPLANNVGVCDVKMFEENINKFKTPTGEDSLGTNATILSKSQIECATQCLSDWVYESCGSLSFSSLEHPKFKSFLQQVGVNEVSKREFFGPRLDSRFEEVRNESNSRIKDVMFFQIASQGWKSNNLVSLTANLPNGTSVYRKGVFTFGQTSSKLAEEVVCETISDIGGNSLHQCVGIVSDKFKNSLLKNLESRYHWMINLSCQFQAFNSLIKDFYNALPLFKNVADSCLKLANFFSSKTLRNCLHKYQYRDVGLVGLLRLPVKELDISSFEPVYVMIEDIMNSARALQLVLLDESFKIASMEDPVLREFGEMITNVGFWNDLEAVRSLVRLVKEMANEFETERPLVGQCLPLWQELRTKVKDWCIKFHIDEIVDKVVEARYRKNYHPAWAAAYILDPLYTTRDTSGKYLPPFKDLSPEQQRDVHDLVTRLVPREEVPIAMSELMRWRSDGLDPVYAQAVQLKQRDPDTGQMKIANPQGSRLVWETYLPGFQSLGKVALRIIFLHATARGFKCNKSLLNWVENHGRSRVAVEKAKKMVFIAAHSKLERQDFTCEDDKDAELFKLLNGDDDALYEGFVDS